MGAKYIANVDVNSGTLTIITIRTYNAYLLVKIILMVGSKLYSHLIKLAYLFRIQILIWSMESAII